MIMGINLMWIKNELGVKNKGVGKECDECHRLVITPV